MKGTKVFVGLVLATVLVLVVVGMSQVTKDTKVSPRPVDRGSWCSYARMGAGTRLLMLALSQKDGANYAWLANGFVNKATPKAVLPPLKILVSGIEDVTAHNKPVGERVASAKTVAAARKVDAFVATHCREAT